MTYQLTTYGIERSRIEAIMQNARRERNAAFRQFVSRIFKREPALKIVDAECSCATPAAR